MGDFWIIDQYNLVLSAALTLGIQLLGFLIAVITDRGDYFFDLFGALNFVLVTVLTLLFGVSDGSSNLRGLYLSACVAVSRGWLGAFLQWRVCTRGSDTRVAGMDKNVSFVVITWVVQSFWVFMLLVPVILVNGASPAASLGCVDVLGLILMCLGFVLQVTADLQKSSFRADPNNRNLFCTVGVWRCSRHPNFFGEIAFWWGVWLSTVPVLQQIGWWSLVSLSSPGMTMFLLVFVSGLPFAEGKFLARFYENGQGDSWDKYRDSTPPLCPIPCGLYKYVPGPLKCVCCCEYSFLEYPGEVGSSSDQETGSGSEMPSEVTE